MLGLTYVTLKFSPGGRNFINHYFLPNAIPVANILDGVATLLPLTTTASGGSIPATGAALMSVTRVLKRTYASQSVIEASDLTTVVPRLITGRLVRTVGANNYTLPFILRGVNPGATKPVGFDDRFGASYAGWVKEFLIKYCKVNGGSPTSVIFAKDVDMH